MENFLIFVYLLTFIITSLIFIILVVIYNRKVKKSSKESLEIRYFKEPYLPLIIGVFVILFVLPFFYLKRKSIPQIFFENPSTIFFIIFLFIGLGFVWYGLKLLISKKNFSKKFILKEKVLKPDGSIVGSIIYRGIDIKREPLKVHLILQKAILISKRQGTLVGEKAIWSQSIETYPYLFKDYIEVPFKFKIKNDFPEYEKWKNGYELVLVVEGENFEVDTTVLNSKGEIEKNCIDEILSEPITDNAKTSAEIVSAHRYKNPILNLVSIFFVTFFPVFMWVLLRGNFNIKDFISHFLFGGFIGTLVFFMPLYLFIKDLKKKSTEEKKRKLNLFRKSLTGFLVISLLFTGITAYEVINGNSKVPDLIFEFVSTYFIDALLGMFFILGLYALIIYVRDLIVEK